MPFAWIALNSIAGLGPVRFGRLLEKYGSPEAVFEESADGLVRGGFLTTALAGRLRDPAIMENARRQVERARELGITILTLADKTYSPYLREIFAPPPVLFVRGDLSALSRHGVAVVGSRFPTAYGKLAATRISSELVESGFVVVSGLAHGIDTAAHEAALAAGGTTIAVLGSGIDQIYPRQNRALSESIAGKGLLVSEFPVGTAPEAFNFPRRNRIISGCSAAVVVVEAGERSGSLITARYALQQGREVCAVPGPINSPLSMGTFCLLRDGAAPVRSGAELAESLGRATGMNLGTAAGGPVQAELSESVFTGDERRVFESLSHEPSRIDELAERHRLPIPDMLVVLLNLELKGLIQQCSGQQFVRV